MASLAVAYALVLQAILASATATAVTAQPEAAGMELCLPSEDGGPAAPARVHPADCCILCTTAGASGALPVAVALPLPFATVAARPLPAPDVAIAFTRVRSGEARGPPRT